MSDMTGIWNANPGRPSRHWKPVVTKQGDDLNGQRVDGGIVADDCPA